MPIAVSCPSCERETKVKDELAGKKIKCPGCGEPIAVKKQAIAKASAQPKPAAVDDAPENDDEREEEERPKKKKQKKKQEAKSNSTLVIGLILGGVALLIVAAAVVVGIMFLGGSGRTNIGNGGARAQGGGRAIPAVQITNRLKQIGLAYSSFLQSGNNAGPKNATELAKFYENDATINELITSNKITIVWGIPKDAFFTDMTRIVAWETQPDSNGIRIVLQALGAAMEMNDAEFQAAKKAKGN